VGGLDGEGGVWLIMSEVRRFGVLHCRLAFGNIWRCFHELLY